MQVRRELDPQFENCLWIDIPSPPHPSYFKILIILYSLTAWENQTFDVVLQRVELTIAVNIFCNLRLQM